MKVDSLAVLLKDAFISPQEIGYYFPDVPVLTLSDSSSSLRLRDRTFAPPRTQDGAIVLPVCNLVWMNPVPRGEERFFDSLGPNLGWSRQLGPLHYVRLIPGASFALGRQHFVVSP